jgi:hypothetical protein
MWFLRFVMPTSANAMQVDALSTNWVQKKPSSLVIGAALSLFMIEKM